VNSDIFVRIQRLVDRDQAYTTNIIREIQDLTDDEWRQFVKELLITYVPGIPMPTDEGTCRVCEDPTGSSLNRFCVKCRANYMKAFYLSIDHE
jgi:hypothetical protein